MTVLYHKWYLRKIFEDLKPRQDQISLTGYDTQNETDSPCRASKWFGFVWPDGVCLRVGSVWFSKGVLICPLLLISHHRPCKWSKYGPYSDTLKHKILHTNLLDLCLILLGFVADFHSSLKTTKNYFSSTERRCFYVLEWLVFFILI